MKTNSELLDSSKHWQKAALVISGADGTLGVIAAILSMLRLFGVCVMPNYVYYYFLFAIMVLFIVLSTCWYFRDKRFKEANRSR